MEFAESLGASIGFRGSSGGNHGRSNEKVQRVTGLLELVRRFAPYHAMVSSIQQGCKVG
jgi:hypothetical protein